MLARHSWFINVTRTHRLSYFVKRRKSYSENLPTKVPVVLKQATLEIRTVLLDIAFGIFFVVHRNQRQHSHLSVFCFKWTVPVITHSVVLPLCVFARLLLLINNCHITSVAILWWICFRIWNHVHFHHQKCGTFWLPLENILLYEWAMHAFTFLALNKLTVGSTSLAVQIRVALFPTPFVSTSTLSRGRNTQPVVFPVDTSTPFSAVRVTWTSFTYSAELTATEIGMMSKSLTWQPRLGVLWNQLEPYHQRGLSTTAPV